MRLMRERFRRTLQLVPPRRLNIPAYNWKPIAAMRGECMSEDKKLIPYTDPSDIHHHETGIHGYQVPVVNAVLRLRESPEQPKHDGNLDPGKYAFVMINEYPHVAIFSRGDEEVTYAEGVHLTASQALSLLEWLKQEEPKLKELAEYE